MTLLTEAAEGRRRLNDNANGDKLNVVIAYELGYAWGLIHEHVSPVYWPKSYYGSSEWNSFAFSSRNFKCDQIPGYNAVIATARTLIATKTEFSKFVPEDVCKNWALAIAAKFGASDFLPGRKAIWSDRLDKDEAGKDDVDWDSIMMYSTNYLGPGVLYDTDLGIILERTKPSQRDIAGLRALYEAGYKREYAALHNEQTSPQLEEFRKLTCG
ncbi:uncharacterized protein B0I36DRAFT_436831 [Microdochium trichocladiopsis]|uniref:Uncharacterized protein n=1 Tax=Microdochium trichocladiopsis TaxID=1682393 RepID=A0A9P8XQ27_9PEZI|nr:uncharacterized protein B0I36DRAFT_436831 [Microdochium trichocladiopsis]KAH7010781.1 hypothetical protein B0I36DRAFT_436831 [Microdochium trichocladiopsis]